jgi:hypothetical protein
MMDQAGTESPPPPPARPRWFNLRFLLQMFFDPRYTMRPVCRYGVPGLFGLLVVNYLFFNLAFNVVILSPILERVIILFVAVVLYKILATERVRYQAVLDYLSQFGRPS